MLKAAIEDYNECECIIGKAMRPIANDLRLFDLSQLMLGPQKRSGANIESLIESSIEMAFKPHTLTMTRCSEIELDWDRHPRLVVPLEFHHACVHAYFRLLMEAEIGAVEIDYLQLDGHSPIDVSNAAVLAKALARARRRRPRASRLRDASTDGPGPHR